MAHEGFADEDGAGAAAREPIDVGARVNAALSDQQDLVGRAPAPETRRETFRCCEAHREGPEIPVVDPDQAGADREGPIQLGLVVDLDQRGEAGRDGEFVQGLQTRVVEDRHDQENGVRAGLERLDDLAFIDEKVLPQQGPLDGGADDPEVFEGTLEEGFIRQDGEAGGARAVVGVGDLDGVEVCPDHTGAGGGLLDFRNETGPRPRRRPEGLDEIAPRSGLLNGLQQSGPGQGSPVQTGHLDPFSGNDLLQNVGRHACWARFVSVLAADANRILIRLGGGQRGAARFGNPSWRSGGRCSNFAAGMNFILSTHNLTLTKAIEEHILSRIEKLEHLDHRVLEARVIIEHDHTRGPDKAFKCSMRLGVRGPDLYAEDVEADLYAAIDLVAKKLEMQIRKRRSRVKARKHTMAATIKRTRQDRGE